MSRLQASLVLDDGLDLFLRQDAAEAGHAAALVAALAAGAVRLAVLGAGGDELVHELLVGELAQRRTAPEARAEGAPALLLGLAVGPAVGVAPGAVRLEEG